MRRADFAGAGICADVVADADGSAPGMVKAPEDAVKQIFLTVLEEKAGGVSAKIRHLDHAGQAAVHK